MPPPDAAAQNIDHALALILRPPQPGEGVHMLGIGGVGMAGLALLLKSNGWNVTGCDAHPGSLLTWLQGNDIPVTVGHDPTHLSPPPTLLVRSPAVSWNEPELLEATQRGLPVIDRGRLLPELLKSRDTVAVAGTHGKTTTSSMVAWFLASAGKPHSYLIGGICPGLGAVARIETDGWMVVEADESDGTLKHYTPEIGVITSMDLDHVDYFHDHARLRNVFGTFAANAGKLIVPEVEAEVFRSRAGGTVTFGFGETAGWRASQVALTPIDSSFSLTVDGVDCGNVTISVPGRHNVLNALAALAAGQAAGLDLLKMVAALQTFQLPKRRYEQVAAGNGIRVISDYAHHPVEIAALLEQARLSHSKRIIAVFQPHRYSRTKAFCEQFADVLSTLDALILVPVYAASEPFIAEGTSDVLLRACLSRRMTEVQLADSVADAWNRLQQVWLDDDLVLIIGAGDVDRIGTWAAEYFLAKKQK